MLKHLQITFKSALLIAALLVTGVSSWGQTNIFLYNGGEAQPAGWTFANNVSSQPIIQTGSGGYWLVEAGSNGDRITTSSYDLSSYASAQFLIKVATYGSGTNNPLKIEVSYNGGTSYTQTVTSTTPSSSTYISYSFNLSQVSSAVKLRFSANGTSGRGVRMQDINLKATAPAGPTVTTGAATNVASTSVTFNGTINANGTSTAASFQYGLTTSYGTTVTASPSPVTGSSATAVSASVSDLMVNTQYNYRAVATQSTATNGSNATFYTLAVVPNAPTVDNATTTSLDVTINPGANNGATTYAIQTGSQYVQSDGTLNTTAFYQTFSAWGAVTVTGLSPDTSYTFTTTGRNGAGVDTAASSGTTGTTLALTDPIITTTELDEFGEICVDSTSAENSFILSGENLTTENVIVGPLDGYTFSDTADGVYNVTVSFMPDGSGEVLADVFVRFTPEDAISYDGDIPVSGGGTTSISYVAASGSGFSSAPALLTLEATAVSIFSATLGGDITDEGCTAIIGTGVVYSTTESPEIGGEGVTQLQTALANADPFYVQADDLMPSTQYYARAYATNSGGTSYGSQITFTTDAYTLEAPVAEAGTAESSTTFWANWQAVAGVTGYRLDVSTEEDFTETVTAATITETFSNIPTDNEGSYQTRSWTGDDGVTNWTAYKARTDQEININDLAVTLRNEADSYIISSTISGGITNLQFDVQQVFAGSNGQLTITILTGADFSTQSFTDTFDYSDTAATYDSGTIENITGDYQIRIDNNGLARPIIDNLTYTGTDTNVESFVTGYEDLAVGDVTSYQVAGLTQGTTYYYRVRAENSTYNVTSDNSNTITAVTGILNTWNGTEWSAGVPPTVTDDANITGAYSTGTEGIFTAANLTIDAGGSFIIVSGDSMTVTGAVINNEVPSAFIIENNANLIQVNDVANTGDIQVFKDSSPLYRLDYTIWSSPVAGQNLLEFSPSTLTSRFYNYSESTDLYTSIDPEANDFEIGRGYLIRMPNDHIEFEDAETPGEVWTGTFEGVPNNGTVSITMETTLNGYNLVGNPYPSPINISDFFATNEGTIDSGSALYFWRKRNDPGTTAYATITNGAYTANSAAGGDTGSATFTGDSSTWVINPGQGFFVEASSASTLTFDNSMRRGVNNSQFFRSSENELPASSRLWLNLTKDNKFSQMAIVYNSEMTLGIDYGWDGKALINSSDVLALYSVANDDVQLAIQARPAFETTDVVPVGFFAETDGSYTISLDHVDGLFTGDQNIYLIDYVTQEFTNLKEDSYTFTTNAGTINNRFAVVYDEAFLGTPVTDVLNNNEVVVYQSNGDITINAGSLDITAVSVYDMRGRAIYNNNSVNASQTTISNMQSAHQVLIVNITTNKGTVSKKVVY